MFLLPLDLFPKNLGNAIFAELCRSLPPPADDSPEARDARDAIAMTHLAAFRPAGAEEAMLAVRIVATEAHARDSLRLAAACADDVRQMMRCRNQAATMMREADRARKELRLCQIARARAQALALATEVSSRVAAAPDPKPAAAAPPEAPKQAEDVVVDFPGEAQRPRRREEPARGPATGRPREDARDHAVVTAVIHANGHAPRGLGGSAIDADCHVS